MGVRDAAGICIDEVYLDHDVVVTVRLTMRAAVTVLPQSRECWRR